MARISLKPGNMLYPVPVVMASLGREGEKPNIITLAWVGTVCSDPPMVSVSVRKTRYSWQILRDTGEFVINLVTADLVRAADYCGVKSGRDVDKFKDMNLTPLVSKLVRAPGIAESPVNIECRITEVKELGSHDMFLARVVGVSADDRFMDKSGKLRLNDAGLVCYSHGEYHALGKTLGTFGFSVKKKGTHKK